MLLGICTALLPCDILDMLLGICTALLHCDILDMLLGICPALLPYDILDVLLGICPALLPVNSEHRASFVYQASLHSSALSPRNGRSYRPHGK